MSIVLLEKYPGYGIGSDGILYSWRFRGTIDYGREPRKRIGGIDASGYRNVLLQLGGSKQVSRRIHELVLSAFVGHRPDGCECRHLDGNKLNNRLDNLEYGTHLENVRDKQRHGTQTNGERHHTAKLTESQVRDIRRRCEYTPHTILASEFGVRPSTISAIKRRENWKHI